MVQFSRPTSDTAAGSWRTQAGGTTNIYQGIDETSASDADYAESGASPDALDDYEVALGSIGDPAVSTGHVVRYRYAKDAAGGDWVNLMTELRQGTTVIAFWFHSDVSATPTDAAQTLTAAQADAITDYAALRLRFRPSAGFSPFSLDDLLAWYDVDDEGLANDAAIAGLTDWSGNGRHITQATSTRRPTNKTNILGGRAVARFDGTTDALQTPTIDLTGFTALTEYVVGKNTAGDGGVLVEFSADASANAGSWNLLPQTTNIVFSRLRGNVGSTIHTSGRGWTTYGIIEHVMDFGVVGYHENMTWVRGGASASAEGPIAANTGAFGNDILNFGARNGGSGSAELLGMDLACYLLYAGAHTATQRHQVARYLSTRFGFDFYTSNVVFDGDSLTAGTGATAGNSYPDQVAAGLTNPLSWSKWGISSQTAATISTNVAAKLGPQASSEVPLNVYVLWAGTNDLVAGASAATTYANLVAAAQAAKANGYQTVVALTALPRTGAPGGFSAARAAMNASIVGNTTDFDAVADVAGDGRIGDDGDDTDTTYYDVGGVHLNNTGYGVVAGIVLTALASVGVT